MENLYELYRLSQKQRKVVETLLPKESKSPLRKLFDVLQSGEMSDSDCMIQIYGRRNHSAFSRLKTRLRDILYFAISFQMDSDYIEEAGLNPRYKVFHEYYAGRALMNQRAHGLAADLFEQAIAKSIKKQQTDAVLLIVKPLILIFGSYNDNKYKFNKYISIQKEYLNIYYWEIRAANYYLDLQKVQLRSVTKPDEDRLREVKKLIEELSEVKDVHTIAFRHDLFRIKAFYYEYTRDYLELYTLSSETLKYFEGIDIKVPSLISNISVRLLWVMIQLGKFAEAIELGESELAKHPEGVAPWIRVAYYLSKAYIYSGDYLNAVLLIERVVSTPKFASAQEYYQEIFNCLVGYSHLIIEFDLAGDKSSFDEHLPEFKLGKFLNTTPVFSKDKRGINISIILLHIAWLLKRKDYSAIIDRTDSLNQYAYRYLRRDDTFRSNCMIKMVIQMTKADFNPIRTERYTADLRKQLSTVPLMGSGENIEIEMIPFEVLWDIMMRSLQPAA